MEERNEIMNTNETTEYSECESSGRGGVSKLAIATFVGVATGIVALIYKKKGKDNKEKRIKKLCDELEKYGCTVIRSDEDDFDEDVIVDDIIEEESK